MSSKTWDWTFDATDTPEMVDTAGRITAGWYRARLTDVRDDNQDGSANLTFTVSVGPFSGQVAWKKIFNPKFPPSWVEDADDMKNLVKQGQSLAKRLGLISDAEIIAKTAVSRPWSDAIGREVVINVVHRVFDVKDKVTKQATGEKGEVTEISRYGGVFPFDHPDIPAIVRTSLNLGPARARVAGDGKVPANGGGAGASGAGGATAPTAPAQSPADIAKSLWN